MPIWYLILLFFTFNTYAINFPISSAVPGGVINVDLDIPVLEYYLPPVAYFADKQVLVVPNNKKYFAVIGLPLDLKPGNFMVKYYNQDNKLQYKKIVVENKKYNISKINIKNENMVNPDGKTQDIILADQKKIAQVTKHRTDLLPNSLIFQQPVVGIKSTSFGARRIINNNLKNPHTGMDIAAPLGSIVMAAGNGKVVLAEKFYLSGNMIAIDHGSGLITLYAHLNNMLVKVGDSVKTGDTIGKVGNTGRVTGPHLHWAVKLNETSVDPALFLRNRNKDRNSAWKV